MTLKCIGSGSRGISQDGKYEFPYDMSCVYISKSYNCYQIFIRSSLFGKDLILFAEYSTLAKGERAMKMLRNACSGVLIMKNIEPDEEAMNVIRNFGKDARVVAINAKNGSDVYPVNGESYFRFPADDI